jgi:probable HAF family extracellular repeat protein
MIRWHKRRLLTGLPLLLVALVTAVAFLPKTARAQLVITGPVEIGHPGGFWGGALGANNLGQVVGYSFTEVFFGAFLWSADEGMTSVPGWAALDINNLGQIVGVGDDRAVFWSEEHGTHYVDSFTPWGYAPYAELKAINDSGTAVGNSRYGAFMWSVESGGVALPWLVGYRHTYVSGINSHGVMVGYADDGIHDFVPVVWPSPTEIVSLADSLGFATAINDLGQVIGTISVGEEEWQSFLWTAEDGMTLLGLGDQVRLRGINNSGQVVGIEYTNSCGDDYPYISMRPVLWTIGGDVLELDTPESCGGANAINDSGMVVGWSQTSIEGVRGSAAVVWYINEPTTPMPEDIIEELANQVEALVDSGELHHGQGQALAATMGPVQAALERNDTNSAVKLLQTFIHKVNVFVNAGKLSAEEGASLIQTADQLILQLQTE